MQCVEGHDLMYSTCLSVCFDKEKKFGSAFHECLIQKMSESAFDGV